MTPKIRSLLRPGCLALLLCAALTACGGESDSDGRAATPATGDLRPIGDPGEAKPGLRCAP
jgi:hypothetical protein